MPKSATPRPVMLVVLDGWGWREAAPDNAVALARTPAFDALRAASPHALLRCSGRDVGLPEGQMGNSEVGHLTLGAGRVVLQDLPRIDQAIADGTLAAMPPLAGFIAALRASGGTAHLAGLVSPGGVHSHQDHALALARVLAEADIPIAIHAWTDGRDTPPRSAPGFLAAFEAALPAAARIATLAGRWYAMDRDNRWERVAAAFRAIALGEGQRFASAREAIADAHGRGVSDEFIPPCVIGEHRGMSAGDGLISFNFRADRVREILAALLAPDFAAFARPRAPRLAAALGMTDYGAALAPLMPALFPPQPLGDILGAVVSRAGLAQLRIAETEKYPHVTYFMNGGEESPFPGEARILVPSPKVATYDLAPEMSAAAVTEAALAAIGAGRFDLIVLNFANADMVGHTGSLAAAIRAVEAVDAGLGAIATAMRDAGGALLVTADHGNAEQMRDPLTGGPHTAHTLNPVPVLLAGGPAGAGLADGGLADVAPTLLALLSLPKPAAMTGASLLRAAGHGAVVCAAAPAVP